MKPAAAETQSPFTDAEIAQQYQAFEEMGAHKNKKSVNNPIPAAAQAPKEDEEMKRVLEESKETEKQDEEDGDFVMIGDSSKQIPQGFSSSEHRAVSGGWFSSLLFGNKKTQRKNKHFWNGGNIESRK